MKKFLIAAVVRGGVYFLILFLNVMIVGGMADWVIHTDLNLNLPFHLSGFIFIAIVAILCFIEGCFFQWTSENI